MEFGHCLAHQHHLGIAQTTALITTHYFWKGMREDIRQYVMGCYRCQIKARSLRFVPTSTNGTEGGFAVGQQILLLQPSIKDKMKLSWNGPYVITSTLPNSRYCVKIGETSKPFHQSVMKKFNFKERLNRHETKRHSPYPHNGQNGTGEQPRHSHVGPQSQHTDQIRLTPRYHQDNPILDLRRHAPVYPDEGNERRHMLDKTLD